MIRWSAILFSGVRHLLVAVAILATVTATVGFHLHWTAAAHHHQHHLADGACSGCDHHHDDHAGVGSVIGDDADCQGGDPGNALHDPDGCGHCHCQVPSTNLPSHPPVLADPGFTLVVHRSHDVVIPDGISFQPDPPPAKG